MEKQRKIIINENPALYEKLEILKKVYNIKTNNRLVEHIANIEIAKHWGLDILKSIFATEK